MALLPHVPAPLDPSFYNLNEEELAFFKAHTGIQDDVELRDHILSVQAHAYAIDMPISLYSSFCVHFVGSHSPVIPIFMGDEQIPTRLRISKHPAYKDVLILGKARPNAIFLDLGCCFGNDLRKAIADGYPRENVIGTDLRPGLVTSCSIEMKIDSLTLRPEFWNLGHELFKTTQETFPVPFLEGDVFDPAFLSPTALPSLSSATAPTPPPLATLKSLTSLQHHISVIHASSFFHLFTETKQRELAHLLGTLLSPLPGSMIFGTHIGVPDTAENYAISSEESQDKHVVFSHSATSWEELWIGNDGVFQPGEVICWTKSVELERKTIMQAVGGHISYTLHSLVWSVTRA